MTLMPILTTRQGLSNKNHREILEWNDIRCHSQWAEHSSTEHSWKHEKNTHSSHLPVYLSKLAMFLVYKARLDKESLSNYKGIKVVSTITEAPDNSTGLRDWTHCGLVYGLLCERLQAEHSSERLNTLWTRVRVITVETTGRAQLTETEHTVEWCLGYWKKSSRK